MRPGVCRVPVQPRLLVSLLSVLILGLGSTAGAQVNDHSGRGGQIGSRVDEALQHAARAEIGSRFYLVFSFQGLVPSDAEAGGAGSLMINRAGGWMMSGFSGLAPTRNVWEQLENGEQLLDLATLEMTDPGPEPVLEIRPLLALIRGRVVARREARIEDISLRFPDGTMRLRDRPVYWLGETPSSELLSWIRSELGSLDVGQDRSVRRDLVGLLSIQPQGGGALDLLDRLATGDDDGDLRCRAISYMGRRPEDTTRRITNIFSRADEPEERAVALKALADREGPASKDRLIEAARDEDEVEKVRAIAISCLGRIEGRDVDALLEELLSSPDTKVRNLTVTAWKRREPSRAVPLLEKVSMTDEDRGVGEQAVASLGDIDDPSAVRALENIFDSSDVEPLRRRAMREIAQKKNGDSDMVDWLAGIARGDPSIEIRKEAVRQLGRTDSPEARKVLEDLLRIGRL